MNPPYYGLGRFVCSANRTLQERLGRDNRPYGGFQGRFFVLPEGKLDLFKLPAKKGKKGKKSRKAEFLYRDSRVDELTELTSNGRIGIVSGVRNSLEGAMAAVISEGSLYPVSQSPECLDTIYPLLAGGNTVPTCVRVSEYVGDSYSDPDFALVANPAGTVSEGMRYRLPIEAFGATLATAGYNGARIFDMYGEPCGRSLTYPCYAKPCEGINFCFHRLQI
ncbi:MAG: hypothetical protein JW727_04125 [Candidatus Aenigmarchaeota archaeon]|nr:hypothetical protein [Candidatus Aenigmarchaeota archaeon]